MEKNKNTTNGLLLFLVNHNARNRDSGFLKRFDTNWPVQYKQARNLGDLLSAYKKSVTAQLICVLFLLEDHWSCSSPERLSHCKLMRFKLIENRPMKVYAWTLLTPGAWPNLTQGHDWHNL